MNYKTIYDNLNNKSGIKGMAVLIKVMFLDINKNHY